MHHSPVPAIRCQPFAATGDQRCQWWALGSYTGHGCVGWGGASDGAWADACWVGLSGLMIWNDTRTHGNPAWTNFFNWARGLPSSTRAPGNSATWLGRRPCIDLYPGEVVCVACIAEKESCLYRFLCLSLVIFSPSYSASVLDSSWCWTCLDILTLTIFDLMLVSHRVKRHMAYLKGTN